ncbi:MAG: HAD-IIA family hydrolase [Tannerella sp.]|nr:HAD-IIA family hydrolase [Tannerella sp.]
MKNKLSKIKHVALDMDGTIYMGDTLFPYTIPFLEKLKRMNISYSFLTNNPSKSIDDYLSKLKKMGIHAERQEVYTTTGATIDYIKERYPEAKRLFLLGTDSMISQFEKAGFASTGDTPGDIPDIIVAAFDTSLTYSRLCRATWWVSLGIPYIATNPDYICPTDQPTILVDCGSICKCIEHATSRTPDITLGKPNPNMLLGIRQQKKLLTEEIAMVGDRIYTDIAMAHNAGAIGVLVLSGETTSDMVNKASTKPDLVVKNIEKLGLLLETAKTEHFYQNKSV